MKLRDLWLRGKGRWQRTVAAKLARRPFVMRNREPLISFTFDDFPRSALYEGGRILEEHGAVGTYYTSIGLMGQTAPTGEIFVRDDLPVLLQRGHELGCHTYAHCHAFDTPARVFEENILENRRALQAQLPEAAFQTLSYPISCPRPATKRRCARYFAGCRAGGQTFNSGTVDLDHLQAFFLEQAVDRPGEIKALIEANARAGGWLIFATHDVCEHPTRYGCRPEFFAEIVRHCVQSGARVLPVSAALAVMGVGAAGPS